MHEKSLTLSMRLMLGFTGLIFYIIHAIHLAARNELSGLLWICHVAAVLIALGILINKALLPAIGVLWLFWGNAMWALYLLGGGEFYYTSVFTHIGGLALGLFALHRMSIPRFAWLWAVFFMAVLQQISHFFSSVKDNVNLSHRVHEGWEHIFPHYIIYVIVLLTGCGITYFFVERILRNIYRRFSNN